MTMKETFPREKGSRAKNKTVSIARLSKVSETDGQVQEASSQSHSQLETKSDPRNDGSDSRDPRQAASSDSGSHSVWSGGSNSVCDQAKLEHLGRSSCFVRKRRQMLRNTDIDLSGRLMSLHSAAATGRGDKISRLLDLKAQVDEVSDSGQTPLHCAAEAGMYEMVQLLLDMRAAVNVSDAGGMTALCLAVQSGNEAVVTHLISNGADTGISTALHFAAEGGHCEILKSLLHSEATVDEPDGDGLTALCFAARAGQKLAAMTLLTEKAKVDGLRPARLADSAGRTPLFLAAEAGHWEVVAHLLTRRANANGNVSADGRTAVMHLAIETAPEWVACQLVERKAKVNARNSSGETPLHLAAKSSTGETEWLQRLRVLRPNVDINATAEDGRTALMIVAEAGKFQHVKSLVISERADVNCSSKAGHTALSYAACAGHWEVVALLLQWRACADASPDGKTSLHLAIEAGPPECPQWVVNQLLKHSANVNAKTEDGETVLHFAARSSTKGEDFDKLLELAHGILDAISAKDGCTALMLTAQAGKIREVRSLVDRKADVNKSNYDGETALHLAAKTSDTMASLHITEALCSAPGIDLQCATTHLGLTALHVASEIGRRDVVVQLLDCRANINKPTKESYSALGLAVVHDHSDVFEGLLQQKANINAGGRNPLSLAAEVGRCKMLRRMLDPKMHPSDKNKEEALIAAAKNSEWQAVELLLEEGAEPSARTVDQQTILHLTLKARPTNVSVVQKLLDLGADIGAEDSFNVKPLDLALERSLAESFVLPKNRSLFIALIRSGGPLALEWLEKWPVHANVRCTDGEPLELKRANLRERLRAVIAPEDKIQEAWDVEDQCVLVLAVLVVAGSGAGAGSGAWFVVFCAWCAVCVCVCVCGVCYCCVYCVMCTLCCRCCCCW